MRTRTLICLCSLVLCLHLCALAAAAPRVSGTFAFPHGLTPGGFVEHGAVAGPGNTVWMTTSTATGSRVKPVLLRISPSGRTTSVKIAAPGGIDFSGVGIGLGGKVWFSGTEALGTHKGVSGVVSGTAAHFAIATDSGDWSQVAVVGARAYLTTGFDILLSSTDGMTFSSIGLENISPFDIAVFNGSLALAGDGAIGTLAAPAPATFGLNASLLTAPVGTTLSSRYETVAAGRIWFLQQESGGYITGIGSAGPDGVATIAPIKNARNITTGPDGAPWVLTSNSALRIGAGGKPTASVKLPHGLSGILICGASSRYIWVAALNRSRGVAKLVRISL